MFDDVMPKTCWLTFLGSLCMYLIMYKIKNEPLRVTWQNSEILSELIKQLVTNKE